MRRDKCTCRSPQLSCKWTTFKKTTFISNNILITFVKVPKVRSCPGGGGSHVACLNFKTSLVGVYKCLSLIVGFAVTVAIWPREDVSCRDFTLRAVATFWAISLVGIYAGRASKVQTLDSIIHWITVIKEKQLHCPIYLLLFKTGLSSV